MHSTQFLIATKKKDYGVSDGPVQIRFLVNKTNLNSDLENYLTENTSKS